MIMKLLFHILFLALATLSFAAPCHDSVARTAKVFKRNIQNAPSTTFQRSKGTLMKLSTGVHETLLKAGTKESALHTVVSKTLSLRRRPEEIMSRALNIPFSARQGGPGLTGDRCSSNSDCATGRVCLDNVAGASRCIPTGGVQDCTSDADCVTGEVCESTDTASFCVSQRFVDEITNGGGTPTPTTPTSGGYTGNLCSTDTDCVSPRFCFEFTDGSASRCVPPPTLQTCTSDSDCVAAEECLSLSSGSFCFSRTIEPEPSPDTGFTGESCSTGTDCMFPRSCVESSDGSPSKCVPSDGLQSCLCDCECVPEELCVPMASGSVCYSRALVPSPSPDVPPPTPSPETGYTGNLCSADADCVAPRTCLTISESVSRCAPNQLQTCESDSDCIPQEECIALSSGSFCFSRTFEPSPTSRSSDSPPPAEEGMVSLANRLGPHSNN